MNFRDQIRNHVAEYKTIELGISDNGKWKRNNRTYPHILPEEKWPFNFLENYRKDLIDYVKEKNIHLHPDFHHLNSSQAICLNFFYPLFVEKRADLLLKILGLDNEIVDNYQFEKVYSAREGTNFDFFLELKSGKLVFFEIKYSEYGFGKVPPREKYKNKFNTIYKNTLAGKVKSEVLTYETLIKNYQLLRNISYVDDSKELFIISPERNTRVRREFDHAVNDMVVDDMSRKIHFFTWEKLVGDIQNELKKSIDVPERLVDHYKMFAEKYMLDHN